MQKPVKPPPEKPKPITPAEARRQLGFGMLQRQRDTSR